MAIDRKRLRRAVAILAAMLIIGVGGWTTIIVSFFQPWFPYALGLAGLACLGWLAWLMAGDWPPPWSRKR